MKKILLIFIFSFFLNSSAFTQIKNIGNNLSVSVPNQYKYFELTFKQLVSRFPDIADDPIYDDLGIGINSKFIIIANNQKTINFFNDVTSISGLEKLNRKTFLFIANPLRIKGATGTPINPIAIY